MGTTPIGRPASILLASLVQDRYPEPYPDVVARRLLLLLQRMGCAVTPSFYEMVQMTNRCFDILKKRSLYLTWLALRTWTFPWPTGFKKALLAAHTAAHQWRLTPNSMAHRDTAPE